MATEECGKRILVLSDSDKLARALELNLRSHWQVATLLLDLPEQTENRAGDGDFDLIVIALSSPASEPVVVLARASLVKHIGRTPMLIISDRPFHPDPEERFRHLGFPFSTAGLYHKVKEILHNAPARVS